MGYFLLSMDKKNIIFEQHNRRLCQADIFTSTALAQWAKMYVELAKAPSPASLSCILKVTNTLPGYCTSIKNN